ncbi:hypothetical protein GRX01_14355 [Halobaculum sp. WSA2]|uniref:Uncharacterized protein n=1 Tax=Halobaculum saliterrae TaxID=2073113 RepID=A0A6B0SV62_9EURY|nr:hypothetical protein [Halobaculum saliterrae]MXR42515.1 hypothetical protein [Halobaculum saliterrae]
MGLRCLLGHDFSEPRTERDREVRGDEVITTITEVKECSRCGETRVVSENKEVTSAAPGRDDADSPGVQSGERTADRSGSERPPDTGSADGTEDVAGATADGRTAEPSDVTDPGPSLGPGDGTVASGEGGDDASVGDEGTATEDGFDHPAADAADGAVDADIEEDAEIIDGDDDESPQRSEAEGRGHGEWPDADANRGGDGAPEGDPEPTEWPDADGPASPVEGEDEDVEFIGDDGDPTVEDTAASEARTDVVPDAKRADEPGAAADPADEDAEFIDGDSPGDWPDQAGEDEGYDAELDHADAGADVSVDGNLTPQVDAEATRGEDVEFIEADADVTESGDPTAPAPADDGRGDVGGDGSARDTADTARQTSDFEFRTTVDDVDTVYVCPECGNNEPVGGSSMRAGDICPECKRGYIDERELQ